MLGLVFWITDQNTLDQPALRNFSLALDRIPFVRDHHQYSHSQSNLGSTHGIHGSGSGKRGEKAGGVGLGSKSSASGSRLEFSGSSSGSGSGTGGSKTALLDEKLELIGSEIFHRPLAESVDAAKRNMSIFASVLKDIEKACFEANSWVAEYVPPEEVSY